MIVKVVMLGNAYVGKTSISDRIIRKRFIYNKDSTIGSAYNRLVVGDVRYDIWDTAGQERYLALTEFYFRDANIVLLVFDITKLDTIPRMKYYYDKVNEINYKFPPHFVIIGNKVDIATTDNIAMAQKRIQEEFPDETYIIASAKDDINIDQIFDQILDLTDSIKTSSIRRYDSLELPEYMFPKEKGCVC